METGPSPKRRRWPTRCPGSTLTRVATNSKVPEITPLSLSPAILTASITPTNNWKQGRALQKAPWHSWGSTQGWQQHKQSCRPSLCSPALHFTQGTKKGTVPAAMWDCSAKSVYYTITQLSQDSDPQASPYASAPLFSRCFAPLDSNQSLSWVLSQQTLADPSFY